MTVQFRIPITLRADALFPVFQLIKYPGFGPIKDVNVEIIRSEPSVLSLTWCTTETKHYRTDLLPHQRFITNQFLALDMKL